MRGSERMTLDPSVAAQSRSRRPAQRAADEVVPARSAKLSGAPWRARYDGAAMNRRLRAFQLAGDEARIRQIADPERKIGALGDEILVAVRHHQIDLEQRLQREERRQQRNDLPHAIGRRQSDAQYSRQPVRAARRALGVVDRGQGVARAGKQASPASVAETCRVVRTRSLTPKRRSSAAMARETEGWERPNSRAAFEKLPLSTVRTNKASCCSRSFIRSRIYHIGCCAIPIVARIAYLFGHRS